MSDSVVKWTPSVAVNATLWNDLVCTLVGGECGHARGNCAQLSSATELTARHAIQSTLNSGTYQSTADLCYTHNLAAICELSHGCPPHGSPSWQLDHRLLISRSSGFPERLSPVREDGFAVLDPVAAVCARLAIGWLGSTESSHAVSPRQSALRYSGTLGTGRHVGVACLLPAPFRSAFAGAQGLCLRWDLQ